MKICGVIAEYDPLHKGHIYHLRQIRKLYDGVVVIMSGHATQRGEISRFDKWSRAKAALLYGADLVIELPTIFSCSSAERFANGAVRILSELSIIDAISFGSESGDLKELKNIANHCLSIEQNDKFKSLLKSGYNYPSARSILLKDSIHLKKPNNILGIEYIKASLNLNVNFEFHTVKRMGSYHNPDADSPSIYDEFLSSSYLRSNPTAIKNLLPNELSCLSSSPSILNEKIILFKLRNMSKENFKSLLDVCEGLENRLFQASRIAVSLDQFIDMVKTKRYTHSRIKRIILYSLLDLKKEDIINPQLYARVLGFNPMGQKILKLIKNKSSILVTPNFKFIAKNYSSTSKFDIKSTNLFALGLKKTLPCGMDFTNPTITP